MIFTIKMAAVVIKEVAGTRAIITIIIKIYMKQKFFLQWACATFCPLLKSNGGKG
jgi:hypothetical protein